MRSLVIFLLSILSPFIHGQPFKNLVFEGGGMRGIAYVGALHEMHRQGYLNNIGKVGGTSVGAITALTLSLGYTPKEIEVLIENSNPKKFNDGTFLLIGGGARLRKHYGWYEGNAFMKWTEGIIEAKTGNPDITFLELHNRKFIDLYVTGTSLNNQKVIIFSHESYPTMKVKDAIRISMSIPFFFKAVFIDSAGNVLKDKKTSVTYDIMVDGGFISNFPIDLFDSIDSSGNRIPDPFTLGFRLDTQKQLEHDKQSKALAPVQINTLPNYIGAFYNFIMENLNRADLTEEDWRRTVSISAELVGPKVKKLTSAQQDQLMRNGVEAMKDYLLKRKGKN